MSNDFSDRVADPKDYLPPIPAPGSFTEGPWQVVFGIPTNRPDEPPIHVRAGEDEGGDTTIAQVWEEADARAIAEVPAMLALLRDTSETIDSYLVGKIPQEHRVSELSRLIKESFALFARVEAKHGSNH